MRRLIINIFLILKVDLLFNKLFYLNNNLREARYKKKYGGNFNYVDQGSMSFEISGDPKKFVIGVGSHIKSNTFIECSGGVEIGDYFHVGRGLTIFSTNHNWKNTKKLPYDEISISRPVYIGNFVWCGANVTILPGSRIGDGVIISAGSIVRGEIPPLSIIAGNPAKIVSTRDKNDFDTLLNKKAYF